MIMFETLAKHYAESPWELLPLAISLVALTVAATSSFFTRRHADRLFRVTQYPQLLFDLKIDLAKEIAINGTYSDVRNRHTEGFNSLPLLVVTWTNATDKSARDMSANFVLKGSERVIAWDETVEAWKQIDGSVAHRDVIGFKLADAMAQAEPTLIQVRENQGVLRDLAGVNATVAINHEDPASQNVVFRLFIEFSWCPVIYDPPRLRACFSARIFPQEFDGVLVKGWEAEIKRAKRLKMIASRLHARSLAASNKRLEWTRR
jgi:hypothetical protein